MLLRNRYIAQFSTSVNIFYISQNFWLTDFKCYQEKEKYKLGDPKSYHYLNQSNCYQLDGISDEHNYLSTRRAMDVVGISVVEQVYYIDLNLHLFNAKLSIIIQKIWE